MGFGSPELFINYCFLYIYWNKTLDEPMVLNEILTEYYLMEVVDEI